MLQEFTECMEMAMNEAYSALEKSANDMTCFYGMHCQNSPTNQVSDQVCLNAQNITTTYPIKKLNHKWLESIPSH